MVKTLASYVREFKKVSFLTPVCMIGEVIMEDADSHDDGLHY